jgi:4-amino-4-deoxy-L-arabinose transferase-like glycosyltransferase
MTRTTPTGIRNAALAERIGEEADVVVVRRARPALPSRRTQVGEILAVLGAPVVLFYLLQAEPYFRQNNLDPQIYMGYAYEPDSLFHRFGNTTYYGVRFGLLWPMEIATKIFGVTAGYFALRWVLAMIGGGLVYWSLRRLASRPVAAVAALTLITSPVALRALMTAYSDTTSLPYLAGGTALLIAARTVERRWMTILPAGMLLALAVHSNPFNAAIVMIVVVCWMLTEIPSRRWAIASDAAVLLAAAVGVTILGLAVYQARFGDWNIIKPSIDAARAISGDGGKAFRSPTNEWLKYHLHLYLPVLLLLAFVTVNLRRLRGLQAWEVATSLMLLGVYLFLIAQQFLLKSTMLETYYYASALAPFEALVIGAVFSTLWRSSNLAVAWQWGATSLVVVLPLLRNVALPNLEVDRFPTIPVLVSATTAALLPVGIRREPAGRSLPAVVASTALVAGTFLILHAPPRTLPSGTLFHPRYEAALGNQDWAGLDVYRLSHEIQDITPPLRSSDGVILVWPAWDEDPTAGTLAGPFVGFSSNFQSQGPGLPFVDEWRVARIRSENIDQLVAFSVSEDELDNGVSALQASGVEIDTISNSVLQSGSLRYFVKIIDLAPTH